MTSSVPSPGAPTPPDGGRVVVEPTEYRVVDAAIAHDEANASMWTITVAWRGRDSWAVMVRGMCWNRRTETWDYEPLPSSRTAAFKRTHRFPLDQALAIAREQAPLVTVMGKTAAEAAAEEPSR